jgi:hypothetical protein
MVGADVGKHLPLAYDIRILGLRFSMAPFPSRVYRINSRNPDIGLGDLSGHSIHVIHVKLIFIGDKSVLKYLFNILILFITRIDE